jgi:FtsP/CotA-like multicopper oxidase with cupredoxin domain
MHTITRNPLKLIIAFIVLAAMFGAGIHTSVAYAACLPTASFELWATPGTATLYGTTSVTIWGYSMSAGGAPTLPGPQLTVNQGDCVSVTLHNSLTETTSLLFQGQDMIPDTQGVAAGGFKEYIFNASRPGTFLYEAGLIPGTQHQVAMGLYGALVVTPVEGINQAYNSPSPIFASDAVLVLSEIDPALNNSPTPATFDMRHYTPTYFLINGKAYPDTIPSFAGAGDTVLLRYVNAGLQSHAMSTLGVSQSVIATDGSPFAHPHSMVAETIATGQTLDALVTIPASAVVDTKYPLYDANMMLRNTNTAGLGGMLTFMTVGTQPPPGPDTTGPLLASLTLAPNPSNGTVGVNLSFNADDTSTGNSNVVAGEYWIDGNLTHTAITVGTPAPIVTLSSVISSGLTAGTHVVSVRAQDAVGNWSTTSTINLVVDNVGPVSRNLNLTPNPSNGSLSVTLSFTADDSSSGNSNVTSAEYWIDAGAHQTIPVTLPAIVKSLSVSIPSGLSVGSHIVSVRSQDALGNWGTVATINLVVDQTGPTTSAVSASPNPNNGSQPYNTSILAVRVFASFSDAASGGSNIAAAEGFLDTVGTTGTGFAFTATDGSFNSPTESGYGDIPLVVIGSLLEGNHTIFVHSKDSSGNWGAMSTVVLNIYHSLYFSTLGNTNPPGVGGTADDADIYFWNGTAFSRVVDASVAPYSLPSGANVDGFDRVDATHFYMSFSSDTTVSGLGTVQDEDIVYYNAGIWSVYFDGTAYGLTANNLDIDAFNISGGVLYFSILGNTNPPTLAGCPAVGGTADDADIYSWNGTCFTRVLDATAVGLATGANVDGYVRVDATHFYLSFASDTAVPGLGTVQDEDVVFYNNGTWIVYFDGTAKGLTANNQDVDAFDIP